MSKQYQNHDIVITKTIDGVQHTQALSNVHIGSADSSIDIDALFELIRSADKVEARAWKLKGKVDMINSLIRTSSADESDDKADVAF